MTLFEHAAQALRNRLKAQAASGVRIIAVAARKELQRLVLGDLKGRGTR